MLDSLLMQALKTLSNNGFRQTLFSVLGMSADFFYLGIVCSYNRQKQHRKLDVALPGLLLYLIEQMVIFM